MALMVRLIEAAKKASSRRKQARVPCTQQSKIVEAKTRVALIVTES